MFYQPTLDDHGLPYNPYKSIVVPRPIGWISTVSTKGVVNLAPYSQFTNLGYDPPYVLFSSSGSCKHSATNAIETGEFVTNLATYELRDLVSASSAELSAEESEPDRLGIEMLPSRLVRPPRVARSPIQLECRFHCAIALPCDTPGTSVHAIVGKVVGVHIADEAFTADGKIDVLKLKPLARLGYHDYSAIESTFAIAPPVEIARGMAGRPQR